MTSQHNSDNRRLTTDRFGPLVTRLLPLGLFLLSLAVFALTLAPGVVFGDPAEYTLVPHLWGILHPPGYAFMTLLVKAWQTVVPLGTLAYRTNLLSATAAALGGVMVYGAVRALAPDPRPTRDAILAALLGAACLYTASDYWQHAIHTNAHIVTACLASVSILLLLRWRAGSDDRWLYAFGVVAGLSVTHHPLLVFGFPAYAVFILWNKPRLKALGLLALCGLLGLGPWLYFPIRASLQPPPPFGPSDMNTLDGFLNLTLARGLTNVNLFHFGLGEQWHRLIVFWSLIQLQYAWPLAALAGAGLAWLLRRDPPAGTLLGLHLFANLAFTLNSVQDVMAYLLVPVVTIAVLIGAGAQALRELAGRSPGTLVAKYGLLILFLSPIANLVFLFPRISLRELRDADAFVDSVFEHFEGQGQHAVLLSDWEHATPLWYRQYVNGEQLDPADLTVVYVNTPFVEAVWEHIDSGPIYLIEYNPAIVNAGFRLRAEGRFYRLEPPPATARPRIAHPLSQRFGPVELLGYEVLADSVEAGGTVPVLLYVRAPEATDQIIHPFATLGPWEYRFTTDSHLLSPYWQPGEIIVERWEVIVPLDAPAGEYPLEIGFSNLVSGEDFAGTVPLGEVTVSGGQAGGAARAARPVANFGQRVAVEAVEAWTGLGLQRRTAPWAESLTVRPGQPIELRIHWRALASIPESYTVFIHLLTLDNVLAASHDYTPLGGAWPTMLWFPKWLPGQGAVDPYSIRAPDEPGEYYFEIGLYGLRSVVRVPAFDPAGNLAGDRFVPGGVTVRP